MAGMNSHLHVNMHEHLYERIKSEAKKNNTDVSDYIRKRLSKEMDSNLIQEVVNNLTKMVFSKLDELNKKVEDIQDMMTSVYNQDLKPKKVRKKSKS